MSRPLLSVKGLRKVYETGRKSVDAPPAVDDVSFDVAAGETFALVGESGSGKSTAGFCVARLLEPTAGSIEFDGVDLAGLRGKALRAHRRDVQMVFQDPYSSLNPRMRIVDIVAEPLDSYGMVGRSDRKRVVADLLDAVGLNPAHAERYPRALSGGQRQRVAIARAVALRPRLIVCDEAISALDVSVRAQIMNLLKDLQDEFGMAYLFIAHDLTAVHAMSDRVGVMKAGCIVEQGRTDDVFASPQDPYTKSLIEAIPHLPRRAPQLHEDKS